MLFALRNAGGGLDVLIFIILSLVAVVIALVSHEVAHGLVAKWNGDLTAKNAGRLTLNPLKHFDPIGFVMMATVGFGYAKPVPVNPYNFKSYKKGMFTVAIAGICMNLILAFFAALFADLFLLGMIRATSDGGVYACYYFRYFFVMLIQINLAFAFFNLLPIFPLDGYRIVETFAGRNSKFCTFMRVNGQYILFGLVGVHLIISMAYSYATLPDWFQYIDVLGTYINFFTGKLGWVFTEFWALMIPGV